MADSIFQFKTDPTNLNPSAYGRITANAILKMSAQEFLVFRNRLMNVRHRTRYDKAIYEAVVIKAGTSKDLFRKGIGQDESYVTSDKLYKKSEFHTNMLKGGEFTQGSVVFIADISVVKAFTSGLPTTTALGAVTNSRATFPTYLDPALNLDTWLEQNKLEYREDEEVLKSDLFRKFPQNDGQTGVIGASQGGIMQNVFMPKVGLDFPRLREGGDDFSLRLISLTDFDASATGINMEIVQKIELETTEVIPVPR